MMRTYKKEILRSKRDGNHAIVCQKKEPVQKLSVKYGASSGKM